MFSLTSLNSVTKVFLKRLFEPATSCVRDEDVSTESARHKQERGSLN